MPDAVESTHPDYDDRITEWQMMRACHRGTKAIKDQGRAYLPMPSGFSSQPDGGTGDYAAYMARARFPDILQFVLSGMVGLIHRKQGQIDLPSGLEPMREQITAGTKTTLDVFYARVTRELLLQGRFSVMTDVAPEEEGRPARSDMPFLAGYQAEALTNWDEAGSLFVLNESGLQRDGFQWIDGKRYRVLRLDGGVYSVEIWEDGVDRTVNPIARGRKPMTEIPFVVAGPLDLQIKPEGSPLIGVAEAMLAMYRLDADYRHQLYNSGQETFVVLNIDKNQKLPTVLGSSVVLGFEGVNVDAKYVSPTCDGIDAHRIALQDERANAVAAGTKLFDSEQKSAESGEALRLRLGAQTATLTTVAKTSAALMERALRFAAQFIGADPNAVVVKPNLEFVDQILDATSAKALMELWVGNAISYETLFENYQRGGLIHPDRTIEEETAEIDSGHAPPDVTPPGGAVAAGGAFA